MGIDVEGGAVCVVEGLDCVSDLKVVRIAGAGYRMEVRDVGCWKMRRKPSWQVLCMIILAP